MLSVILGESHDMASYRYIKKIVRHLTKINAIDMLLEENAFDYKLNTVADIENKIKNEDYMISDLYYKLGLEFSLPIHGIDLNPDNIYFKKPLSVSFKKREDNMLSVAKSLGRKYSYLLIVGDTHLRSYMTKELGRASPLHVGFRVKKDSFVVRADKREIDFKLPSTVYTYKQFWDLIQTEEFIKKYKRKEKLLELKP